MNQSLSPQQTTTTTTPSSDFSQGISPSSHPGATASASPGDHQSASSASATGAAVAVAPTGAKRFQVPRACERCKRLRRGCSEYRPCKRCIDAGLGSQCLAPAWAQTAVPSSHPGGAVRHGVSAGANSGGVAAMGAPAILPAAYDEYRIFREMNDMMPERGIDYCTQRFFTELHPTIPILTVEYVTRLKEAARHPERGMESFCALVGMSCQVLLQAEDDGAVFLHGHTPERNGDLAHRLLDLAKEAYRRMSHRSPLTMEMCLFTFFLYTCEVRLSHHSSAFTFLREVTTYMMLFRPPDDDPVQVLVYGRLFWVVLVSERSNSIRYRRPISMQITQDTPPLDTSDASLAGFWSLAALFRPLDTSFIALWNTETLAMAPSPDGIDYIEAGVNAALNNPVAELRDTQKANLRVTQIWLRHVLWSLRLRLGYLVEEAAQASLTFRYPIVMARDLAASTRDLSVESMRVHGVGMTEKLYDVTTSLVDVLAGLPPATAQFPGEAGVGSRPEDDLAYLRGLIKKLPLGETTYDGLVEKHMQDVTPHLVRRSQMPDILMQT